MLPAQFCVCKKYNIRYAVNSITFPEIPLVYNPFNCVWH